MAEFMKTFNSPADAEKQLPNVKCPCRRPRSQKKSLNLTTGTALTGRS